MAKRGRPRLSLEALSEVHLKMPVSLYDRIYAAASAEHISVPEIIRRAVYCHFRNLKSTSDTTSPTL